MLNEKETQLWKIVEPAVQSAREKLVEQDDRDAETLKNIHFDRFNIWIKTHLEKGELSLEITENKYPNIKKIIKLFEEKFMQVCEKQYPDYHVAIIMDDRPKIQVWHGKIYWKKIEV